MELMRSGFVSIDLADVRSVRTASYPNYFRTNLELVLLKLNQQIKSIIFAARLLFKLFSPYIIIT